MSSYKVEFAKSGRASCKKCKEKINKGEIRLGADTDTGEFTVTSWYHPKCFNMPRKFSTGSDKITAEEFVENHVEDASEDGNILPDKLQELAEAIASKASPVKKEKEAGSGNSFLDKIKAEYETVDMDAETGDSKADKKKRKAPVKAEKDSKKKSKTEGSTADAVALYGKYHKCKTDELKDILRWNRQVLKGTKDVILHKVIDGEMNGRLSFCSCCDGGKLKFADDCSKVVCSGTFDENTQQRISCDVSYSFEDAPRSKLPWLTEPPTKEQEEAMDAEKEAVQGGGGGDNPALATLMEKAKDLEMDFSGSSKIKESTKKMIELLESSDQKLDLPDDNAQAVKQIGKFMLANKNAAPDEMVKLIATKFGFVKDKANKVAKKEAAAEGACVVPENAPLYCAMNELAELYAKEGNRNATSTYKKVANAIKELDRVVTPENAKGMGKAGPTKVQNIGKSTADKMYEFVTTGTIEKLEQKRQDAA